MERIENNHLRMIATDRLQAERIATGGKNVHTVAREYGTFGYNVPVAQSTTYSLETHPSDDDITTNMANISTDDSSQMETLLLPSSQYPLIQSYSWTWTEG